MTHHTYIPSSELAGPEDVVSGPGRLQGRLVLRTDRLALVDFGSALRWLPSDQIGPSKRERQAQARLREEADLIHLIAQQRRIVTAQPVKAPR